MAIGLHWETVQASMVEIPYDFVDVDQAHLAELLAGGVASALTDGWLLYFASSKEKEV